MLSNTGIIQVSHEHWDVAMCYLILGLFKSVMNIGMQLCAI